jgi:hypothetical protein
VRRQILIDSQRGIKICSAVTDENRFLYPSHAQLLGWDYTGWAGTSEVRSAAIGPGAARDYEPHLYVGASGWLICHVPFKKTDIFHNLGALPSAIPGRCILTNEQESAGGCLQYLRNVILFPQDELWFSGIFRDAPPNVGRIANPTYAAPPDMLVYHGNSQ